MKKSNKGYGGLSLSIEGPSKADIECFDNEDGSCRVTYKPTEPGVYFCNIKFADKHVEGSPFTVKISDNESCRLTERITREREAVDVTKIGSQCLFSLKLTSINSSELTAYVTSPSGQIEQCEIIDMNNKSFGIQFVPKEIGVHTVSVKNMDIHIPGSPFEFTVGQLTSGGAYKVRAIGSGLHRGEVNFPNEFNIYTREAGAGALAIAIEGPAKAEIDFYDHKDGACAVSYICSEPGEYQISIKFNDEHIPDSPFNVFISPPIGDAKLLTVHSIDSKNIEVNKPFVFRLNFNGKMQSGRVTATAVTPTGSHENCQIQQIDEDYYNVRFVPFENGVHTIHIRYDDNEIPESPIKISVGSDNPDPGRVFVKGNGLSHGEVGESCEFLIDTMNAGAGALAVTVDGPAKVMLDCRETNEGYKVNFVPTAPGDYLITIKFVGVNIAGSPFKCHVTGQSYQQHQNRISQVKTNSRQHSNISFEAVEKSSSMSQMMRSDETSTRSDASKCRVQGSGLFKAFKNENAEFIVDTCEAGKYMPIYLFFTCFFDEIAALS
jgi:filamin